MTVRKPRKHLNPIARSPVVQTVRSIDQAGMIRSFRNLANKSRKDLGVGW
jgi:hypothetical protein